MSMWIRLAGAVLLTLAAFGLLERFGVGDVFNRAPAEMPDAAHGRPREIFWFLIFAAVMATSLLAAARRGREQLVRALRRKG
jgi:hypothetical protein